MSNTEDHKPQAAKPSRLSGLVAPKGVAPRPSEPAPAPQAAVEPVSSRPPPTLPTAPSAAPAMTGTGSKSLTLRLPDAEYERLRARAYATRMTHQGILAEALRRYLDDVGNA